MTVFGSGRITKMHVRRLEVKIRGLALGYVDNVKRALSLWNENMPRNDGELRMLLDELKRAEAEYSDLTGEHIQLTNVYAFLPLTSPGLLPWDTRTAGALITHGLTPDPTLPAPVAPWFTGGVPS